MKYTTKVIIKKEVDVVYNALDDKESAFKWIDGLETFDLLEGINGEVNSKYKMIFKDKKGNLSEMTETIKQKTDNTIVTVYEAKGVWNECINNLISNGNQTIYEMKTTFKFGVLTNLFIWILKPMFKKETLKGLNKFKEYCESIE